MKPEIVPFRAGYSNSVLLVNGSSSVLIDTGVSGHLQTFKNVFQQNKLQFEDIKLIILTHTHHDHTGNLPELAKLTGAGVLVHKNEFDNLKNGFTPIPPGIRLYPKFISKVGRIFRPKFASPPPFEARFINYDEFDLNEFGIDGKIISTPGHSAGSQSVLIGNELICGDTFINLPKNMFFPHFVEDPKTLLQTWQKLFELGIEKIYPGHGKPFKTEKAYPEFKKWSRKFNS